MEKKKQTKQNMNILCFDMTSFDTWCQHDLYAYAYHCDALHVEIIKNRVLRETLNLYNRKHAHTYTSR